jgi:peroxiredoxin
MFSSERTKTGTCNMLKRIALPFFYVSLALFAALARHDEDVMFVPLRLVNGASETVRYYLPQRLELRSTPREQNVRHPAFHGAPRFGALVAGTGQDSLIAIALDESPDGLRKIYIDKNNDENLANDGSGDWRERRENYLATPAIIDVALAHDRQAQLAFQFYRFDKRLPEALLYYRDYYASGGLLIDERRFEVMLIDENADGRFSDLQHTTLVVDENQDGKFEAIPGSAEIFGGREPFHLDGESYILREVAADGRWAKFAISPRKVSPKARLEVGQPAPEFSMPDFDGRPLRLAELRGRVVLLNFWATWCKPCLAELPALTDAYRRFSPPADSLEARRDFETIGISLDDDRRALERFLANDSLPWRQLFDGQGWSMEIARQYRVAALPRSFLLDRNGIIRYVDPRSSELPEAIAELLREKSF